MLYLVQQDPDYTPVGIWAGFFNSYYPPQYFLQQRWGESVLAANSALSFEDYAERLADSTPTPSGSWNLVELPEGYDLQEAYSFVESRID